MIVLANTQANSDSVRKIDLTSEYTPLSPPVIGERTSKDAY